MLSDVDFNKFGKKNNQPFEPVGAYFIDTVIVTSPIGYNEDFERNKVIKTTELRYFIQQAELPLQNGLVCLKDDESIFKWKLACSEVDADAMLHFLSTLSSHDFSIYEIDVTRDYAGSFSLNEVVSYFKQKHGLVEGFDKSYDGFWKEIDMKQKTGFNCFVFKKGNIRYKMYLKFPQMICKNRVRDNIGLNLMNWVNPDVNHARLHASHQTELARQRGLSRFEISIKNPPLKLVDLIKQHEIFMAMLCPSLTWSSSHSMMWESFASNLKHTLIVVDENFIGEGNHIGMAVVVYAFDSATADLCGFLVNNWQKNCSQIMAHFTASSSLPIDMIKMSKIQNGANNLNLEIQGVSYAKVMKQGYKDVTYLTDSKGRFCISHTPNEIDFEACGLVEHPNICLSMPSKRYRSHSFVPAHFVLTGEFDVLIVGEGADRQFKNRFLSEKQLEVVPLFYKSKILKTDVDSETDFMVSNKFSSTSVRKLKDGFYDILKIKKFDSKQSFPIMAVNVEGDMRMVSMNGQLAIQYEKFTELELVKNKRLHIRKINKRKTKATLKLTER
jgi:hypothetical protein